MWLKKTLWVLLAITFVVATLEVAGRWIVPPEYVRLVGDVDHRMKPFSDKDINEDGIRFKGKAADVAGQHTVIFLGDSYTFGHRLRYRETIPQQFEALYNQQHAEKIRAVNFGWISSSPVLSDRLLKDIGKKYQPRTVFLLLDMTDFWDDNFYTQMLGGSLTGRAGKVLPLTTIALYQAIGYIDPLYRWIYGQPLQRYYPAHQPLEQSLPHFANTLQAIHRIKNYSEQELHANFVLVVLPRSFQYSEREAPHSLDRYSRNLAYVDRGPYVEEPFRFFEQYRQQVNFPVLLLLEDFKNSGVFPTTFDNDPHYNPAGAQLAASALLKHCNELKCVQE